jgi:hypothetical protein
VSRGMERWFIAGITFSVIAVPIVLVSILAATVYQSLAGKAALERLLKGDETLAITALVADRGEKLALGTAALTQLNEAARVGRKCRDSEPGTGSYVTFHHSSGHTAWCWVTTNPGSEYLCIALYEEDIFEPGRVYYFVKLPKPLADSVVPWLLGS